MAFAASLSLSQRLPIIFIFDHHNTAATTISIAVSTSLSRSAPDVVCVYGLLASPLAVRRRAGRVLRPDVVAHVEDLHGVLGKISLLLIILMLVAIGVQRRPGTRHGDSDGWAARYVALVRLCVLRVLRVQVEHADALAHALDLAQPSSAHRVEVNLETPGLDAGPALAERSEELSAHRPDFDVLVRRARDDGLRVLHALDAEHGVRVSLPLR
mmetsp:Transcript_32203/g.102438  ORF Transcript_32203/g.102438 Transcript_32203/m.102438 type:complete len:213 (+) Transcript_32203:54-692(+)